MNEINGTVHRISVTDYFQRCKNCGRETSQKEL